MNISGELVDYVLECGHLHTRHATAETVIGAEPAPEYLWCDDCVTWRFVIELADETDRDEQP